MIRPNPDNRTKRSQGSDPIRIMASSAEKEQLEELGRAESTPDSRFRTAAWISARSAMDGAGESAGRVASRWALRREAVTGVEVERGRLAYATVGGG